MSNLTENIIVPKLRFPDYRKNNGWREKLLSQVANYENGKAHEQDISEYGDYIVVNSKFISSDGEVKKYSNTGFCLASNGDTLMVLSDVPNGKAIAKCYFVNRDNYFSVNQRICKLTPKAVNSQLLFYILNRNPYFLAFDDGVKQTNLKNEDVLNFPFYLPETPEEQQKIADCLSSLDDLITAETQKLDALKDHKKGLMQQLFPGEGEMVPKLRFEEFRGSGEWGENLLSETSLEKLSNGVFNDPSKVGSGYRLINVVDMYIESYILDETSLSLIDIDEPEFVKNKVEFGDIFFTRSSLVKAGIAHSNIFLGKSDDITFDGHLIRLRPNKKKIHPLFLHYNLKTSVIRKQLIAKGKTATMTTIGQSDVSTTKALLPHIEEQKIISDFLATIDKLIIAQKEKINALQYHRKGLMQGLFPNFKTN